MLHDIIDHYGPRNQLIKTAEELAELQIELLKYIQGSGNIQKIEEEMADVLVMLEQTREILSINQNDISKMKIHKINRTRARIKESEQNKWNNQS